jgi:CheY-like chemotaxis protein
VPLILLDAALPQTSGLDVLQDLRARDTTREIPVILVSAYAGLLPPDQVAASAILQKPIDPADLLRWVHTPRRLGSSVARASQ